MRMLQPYSTYCDSQFLIVLEVFGAEYCAREERVDIWQSTPTAAACLSFYVPTHDVADICNRMVAICLEVQ